MQKLSIWLTLLIMSGIVFRREDCAGALVVAFISATAVLWILWDKFNKYLERREAIEDAKEL